MDVETNDYDKVGRFHDALTKNMSERFGVYNQKAADMAVDLARNNLQNNGSINSGELLGDIGIKENNNKGMDILIGTYKPWAIYIEFGRGPIRPVTAKVLHWKDKDTGDDVFSMYAGPTEPEPFFEPAIIVVKSKYKELVITNESRFIGGIAVG